MNPQLFDLYKRELQYMRDMGGEFANEYPKVAGRLGLETLECTDPYVERLLEGFAFLAARVQLKIENSHSQLARHLLEMIYPTYLAPTPSMVITEFEPSMNEGSLAQGVTVERGTRLRSQVVPEEQTECDFRTAHDLTLWPVAVDAVTVLNNRSAIEATGVRVEKNVRSALSIKIKTVGGHLFSELPVDQLLFYISGADSIGFEVYEQMFSHTQHVSVVCNGEQLRSPRKPVSIERYGFSDKEALLPVSARGFQGHRLLQEYFAFPERFLFMNVQGLSSVLPRVDSEHLDIVFSFDNKVERESSHFTKDNFKLHCVPAINLFEKSVDRIHLDRTEHIYHIVPDRTKPMDYEVYSVLNVEGKGSAQESEQTFAPFFSVSEARRAASCFYSVEREPRLLSAKQRRRGARASYIGSELFIALVDSNEAPYRSDIKQISIQSLCTNRDLPMQMPIGKRDTDFNLDIGAPVDSVRCIAGPTEPRASRAHFRDAWRLVSNLNLNYLSIDSADERGESESAAMLRQMLELHLDDNRQADLRQLEGIIGVSTKPVVRQRKNRGRLEIAHGLQITIRTDETAFEGTGVFLLASVLERYFARHCTVNSFTETVLESVQRNEIRRWPVRLGSREAI